MRKRVFGRQFNKDTNQRKALFKSLIRGLVLNERIKTTEARAKAIKGEIEKIITKARNRGVEAKYHLRKRLDNEVIEKIISDIVPRFQDRPGGYTRIIKLGSRVKDNASLVLMEWVEGSNQNKNENIKMKKDNDKIKKKDEVLEIKEPVKKEASKKPVKEEKKPVKKTTAKKTKDEKDNTANKNK